MESEDPFALFQMVRSAPNSETPAKLKRVHLDPGLESEEENKETKLEQIQIEVFVSEEGCVHQVFCPKNFQRTMYNGEFGAKQYPFKLDDFQVKAINAICSNQSVLVCAHTSAGKTAIAEYAIALSLQNHSRVIYTSPIKALSNQKYRELKEQFEDVGLITGDVTIEEQSTCLVMTTEILRNMIYRGNSIVRQVKWVIFDEVHYMRDKERGVVWEETIIMLPPQVRYVFLSATIGNPSQFATWITKLRRQPCNVVYTDYRPVPLEHYLCPAGGEGLFLVVDDKGHFHNNNFNKAVESLGDASTVVGMNPKKKRNFNQGSDLSKIIKTVMETGLDPVIVFSFSKKDVESYARSICLKYDLTKKDQKERINQIFTNSLNMLDEKDRVLPQITCMREIVKKGVGIHHGGLLPLIKEVVELLFQDGLIKVLFSTETFSMGLNMPARTVVFTSVRKFDGQKARWIRGGEYIQMSGRAGRRGLDKKGTTILMIDEKMEPQIARDMLKGQSDDLLSSFYLNYHMLLNSQRLEDIDIQYILARSLLQFQRDSQLPQLKADHQALVQKYEGIFFQEEPELENLFLLKQQLKDHKNHLRKLAFTPQKVLPFLSIGRIIKLVDHQVDWGYGISINFHQKQIKNKKNIEQTESIYLVDCMVYIKSKSQSQIRTPIPANISEPGQLVVLTFSLSCISQITAFKISNLPNQLLSQESKEIILNTLKKLSQNLPLRTISIDANDSQSLKVKQIIIKLEQQINTFKHLQNDLENYSKKRAIYEQIKQSNKHLKECSAIVLKKQKRAYQRVIKRAGLVQKGVVTLKGNVACEINSNHEILLTELLFSGFFNDMEDTQIAAVLSSLVHQQKSSTERSKTKNPKLKAKLEELVNTAKTLSVIFVQCKVSIEQDQYVDSIKEQLIQVTYQWCKGADFATVCKMSDTYEGSIIRTLRRLNELLKNLSAASKIIGNEILSIKLQDASKKLFRGIVFAASLYTF